SAGNRLHGDTSDDNETIHVGMDGGKVVVWSDQFGVSETIGELFEFSGVTKIVADGGAGDDFIDLSGVDAGIATEIHGGDGNDTAVGGPGADALFGDGGNDVLI